MPDGVIWIAVGLAALAAVGMVWCCLYTGKEMPEERKEEACAWCLRWSECNGVDEECPVG